jgi:hypothetical protein
MNIVRLLQVSAALLPTVFITSCDTPQGQEVLGQVLQVGGGIVGTVSKDPRVRNIGRITYGVGTVIVIKARQAQASQLAEARRRAQNYRGNSRYIAQKVSRDKNATGAASVVLYDTKTERVVGNSVYDLKSVPGKGAPIAVNGKTAEFSP